MGSSGHVAEVGFFICWDHRQTENYLASQTLPAAIVHGTETINLVKQGANDDTFAAKRCLVDGHKDLHSFLVEKLVTTRPGERIKCFESANGVQYRIKSN
jgi:hypothetical protein